MTVWLVCGSRQYGEVDFVFQHLDDLACTRGAPSLLIHGGSQGVDKIAGWWADRRRVPKKVFPADWKRHGKPAGPLRNQQMIDEGKPDLVISFRGGVGTADMIARATAAGIPIIKIGDGFTLLGV